MITVSESLGWLNQFTKSHLSSINQQLIAIANNQLTSSDALQHIIKAALAQVQASPHDRLDYAETLLNCAVIECERGFSEQAKVHISDARRSYMEGKDNHAVAIASWMLGIIELSLLRVDYSYINWYEAIKTFDKLRDRHKHVLNTYSWYTTAIGKMNQDLVTLPHESFWWLNRFARTRLSDLDHQFIESINESIRKKQFERAYQTITILKKLTEDCRDVFEIPEIFVETGFAAYRMGNPLQAIQDIKQALVRYPAGSHRREVLHWMLGAIQWEYKEQMVEAVRNWKKSLDGFHALAKQSEREKREEQKCWYEEKIVYMQQAFIGKISETYC
jgi:tetratricopeptide (TPR) repeat protein